MNMMISYQELVRTFLNSANAAEKLNILVAHYVKHLSPQQQAACYDDYQ